MDNDPIVTAHARALLAGDNTTTVIQTDARRPDEILNHPDLRKLIDFDRPVGVLFVAILHFIPDGDDPYGIAARFRDTVAPGSFLTLSHVEDNPLTAPAKAACSTATAPASWRTREQVARFFDGFRLVHRPGVHARVAA